MNPTEELVDLLDLEQLDGDLFRGKQPESARARVYGGQVAAQALMAGIRTVPVEYAVHSLHSYFLLGGDYAVPIVYDVERIRDGRSFLTRRVVARQHGRPIYYQTLNFQKPEEGYEHQDAMPEVGAPETGFDLVEVMRRRRQRRGRRARQGVGRARRPLARQHPLRPRARRRPRLAGPDVGPAARGAAATTRRVHARRLHLRQRREPARLDAVGPRRATRRRPRWPRSTTRSGSTGPFRADEWWLYDQWSPSAQGARGLAFGRIFTDDGTLVATAAQEGLIRPRREDTRARASRSNRPGAMMAHGRLQQT